MVPGPTPLRNAAERRVSYCVRIASAALVDWPPRDFFERPEKIAVRIRMTPRAATALIPRTGRLKVVM